MKKSVWKLIVVKNLLIEWTIVPQNSAVCALVDCNQPVMTVLFEYSGSLAWFHSSRFTEEKSALLKSSSGEVQAFITS